VTDFKAMIYDFKHICKTYDKNFYTREYFNSTRCPKCRAIGRFYLHGSYSRYIVYFNKNELVHGSIEIKRIRCCSCDVTHAVLPGDIIAYKLLSFFVMIAVLFNFYLKKISVLKLAARFNFSFQFIYLCLKTFKIYVNKIHQFFRQTEPNTTPESFEACIVLNLIQHPYMVYQYKFVKLNNSPCFMCKFHKGVRGPPIGILDIKIPPKACQHKS
jgi:hypothetical protein